MRDFQRTPEPRGREGAGGNFFIVQKHAARRLHYDFRLAHQGVLLSWAVPRGPSLDPEDKRLAVRTEDHPLDYATFEGTIPKGEYGGGTVMLWDHGAYQAIVDLGQGLEDGKIKIALKGERLCGGFALVRMRRRNNERQENWLLIKEKDEEVRADWDPDAFSTSITSGRKMAEIREGTAARKAGPAAPESAAEKPSRQRDAAKLPAFVAPQLASLADKAPEGEDWLHEIKYDGYRLLAAVSGGRVVLYTRSGQDWTRRFGSISDALARMDLPVCLLDGEVVAADRQGRGDFASLQRDRKSTRLNSSHVAISYAVFCLKKKRKNMQRCSVH